MKIAIACSGSGNIKRGYETFAEDLFTHLESEIDVTLFKGGGAARENEKVLPNIKRNSILLGGKRSPISWEKRYSIEQCTFSVPLAYELFKDKYDIIHFSDPQLGHNLFHLKKIWNKALRLLFSNGGPISPEHYRRFDFIQQLTPYYFEEGSKAGIKKNKMDILPYGVDTDFFNPKVESSFREKYDIPYDKFLVLSVGTINKTHKRMHWIINEIARLKEKPYLMIIGEEDNESWSIKKMGQNLLQGAIKFLSLDRDKMPEAYRASDIFVSASLSEGLPNVLLEAMATGLPIITHDHPNQRWIVKDGGILVDMEKKNELASKIEQLMENDKESRGLGILARGRAEKTFSWRVLTPKYIKMYEKVQKT